MAFHGNDAPIQDFWNDRDERFGEPAFCDSDPGTGELYHCSSLACPVHGSRNRVYPFNKEVDAGRKPSLQR